jgi:mono/diheme cytochrome c family protein
VIRRLTIVSAAVAAVVLAAVLIRGSSPAPGAEAVSAASPAGASVPTFDKDIAPIVFANCASCHRPGEVAPFPLLTYQQVSKHAQDVVDLTADRTMPPWKAAADFGDFAGVRRLTDAQIVTLKAWQTAGRPEGNPADLPPQPTFASGWQLGVPDLVVSESRPFTVPAEGRDVYRCFVVPLNLTEEKYVSAVEFRASNPRVVHHALFFLDTHGAGRQLESQAGDGQPGYWHSGGPGFTPTGGLGGWAPGFTPMFLPDGVGRPITPGSDLVIQTHFHPTGKPEQEQSTIGLYFTKKPPEKVLISFPKADRRIDIAAGDKDYRIHDQFTIHRPVTLEGIIPHAHLLCQEIKVAATLPDGTVQPLIWIPKWDWGWQEQYQYVHPLSIPAGTRVDIDYRYDNSTDNDRNPHTPPQRVTWGEQTGDEMAIVFFQVEINRNDLAAFLAQAIRQRLQERATTQPAP